MEPEDLGLAMLERNQPTQFSGKSPFDTMTPVPRRHLVGIGILGIMSCVIRLLAGLVFFCFRVLASAFYSLLAKPDDLLLASFTSFNNVRFGFMSRGTLRRVAFHLVLLVSLGSSHSFPWFVRHN